MLLTRAVGSRFNKLWRSYCQQLQQRPLITKCITGVVGAAIADGTAQYSAHYLAVDKARKSGVSRVFEPTFEFDAARLARFCIWAAIGATPVAHYWFGFLDQRIMPATPTSPQAVVMKLALDQLLMAPAGIAVFYAAIKTLEGKPEDAGITIKEKLWPTLQANWLLWPAANLLNFAVIPPSQRILYINIVAIGWTCFLSHMTASKTEIETAEDVVMKVQ